MWVSGIQFKPSNLVPGAFRHLPSSRIQHPFTVQLRKLKCFLWVCSLHKYFKHSNLKISAAGEHMERISLELACAYDIGSTTLRRQALSSLIKVSVYTHYDLLLLTLTPTGSHTCQEACRGILIVVLAVMTKKWKHTNCSSVRDVNKFRYCLVIANDIGVKMVEIYQWVVAEMNTWVFLSLYFMFVNVPLAYMYLCVLHVCLVPGEVRKGNQIPWN